METKKKYAVPSIEIIMLDNEISLTLDSNNPPWGPLESVLLQTPGLSNDPVQDFFTTG
ncbi:MAG: hypothetical protein NTY32_08955 [Bacteroidia bacterium]|nr:hypothetical protein [Bacteroidia bacterium]